MSETEHATLPPELLLTIIGFLPAEHILRCRCLSHSMHDLLSSSAEIQYKIELYCARQREVETISYGYNIPIAHRLQTLRSVTNSWAALRFSRHSFIGYPIASSYVYEVSGGRLVLGSDPNRTAGHLNGTSVLSIHDLPTRPDSGSPATATNKTGAIQRRDINLATPIADFAMDVHQNLLVLVQRAQGHSMKLLIHTLDANIPHPDAATPILEIQNQTWVTLHISGSLLACLFVDIAPIATDVLILWDWRSGHMIGEISGLRQKSFVLISTSSFVVANLDQKMLDIYQVDIDTDKLNLVQRLELPTVGQEDRELTWSYDDCLLRSHPNPLPSNEVSPVASTLRAHTELPFTTDEEDGIVSCTFYCHSIGSNFTLVVHRSALQRTYKDELPWMSETREARIPWSVWGPKNTRWINTELSQRWICYVHGHRLAVLEARSRLFNTPDLSSLYDSDDDDDDFAVTPIQAPLEHMQLGGASNDFSSLATEEASSTSDDALGYQYLRVFDFNSRAIRRALIEGKTLGGRPDAPATRRVGRGQMMVTGTSVLQGGIVTQLPYLETTARLRDFGLGGREIEGVMMNAESVMVMMGHSSQADGVDVLTV